MTFAELLSTFKSMESEYLENIIVVTEDPGLRNGLLAWNSMEVQFSPEIECPAVIVDEKKQWSWLWSAIKYDHKKFAMLANVKEYEATALLERLKSLRMVYPDGTANNTTRKFLREQVSSMRPGWNIKLKHHLKNQEAQDHAQDKTEPQQ
jgi:hypothetical protein